MVPGDKIPPKTDDKSWKPLLINAFLLINGITEIISSVVIFILELTALGLSTDSATGAGIWCSIPFLITGILEVLLGE